MYYGFFIDTLFCKVSFCLIFCVIFKKYLQSDKWLEGVYDDTHKNETIDDWIVDDDLCEEIFPINQVFNIL